jgi:WD40 repeat protein
MLFTPDGRSLVAPEPDGAVGVWDVASGTLRAELRGHTMPVNGLALSADGATVFTASQDGTVRSFPLPSA